MPRSRCFERFERWFEEDAYAFWLFYLAERFNDPKFEKVGELSVREFNAWVAYFKTKRKLEERELRRAEFERKHSVVFC